MYNLKKEQLFVCVSLPVFHFLSVLLISCGVVIFSVSIHFVYVNFIVYNCLFIHVRCFYSQSTILFSCVACVSYLYFGVCSNISYTVLFSVLIPVVAGIVL